MPPWLDPTPCTAIVGSGMFWGEGLGEQPLRRLIFHIVHRSCTMADHISSSHKPSHRGSAVSVNTYMRSPADVIRRPSTPIQFLNYEAGSWYSRRTPSLKYCLLGWGASRNPPFQCMSWSWRDNPAMINRLNVTLSEGATGFRDWSRIGVTLSVRTHSVRPTCPIIMELGIWIGSHHWHGLGYKHVRNRLLRWKSGAGD